MSDLQDIEGFAISTAELNHFAIVAGICQEINLIRQIDNFVGAQERKVSVGEAVQALIVNALAFVSRPLYLTPEFFKNKPIECLVREGLEAEDFNDFSLGRALDRLYQAGVTEVFAMVASHALEVFGIEHRFCHLDSTSFTLHGEYETPYHDQKDAIKITHGHSKDHRPDLKQAVVNLICSHKSSIPIWLETLNGNSSDKTFFPAAVENYIAQLKKTDSCPCFVADSALYTAKNLRRLSTVRWLTRAPELIKEVRRVEQAFTPDNMTHSELKGYKYAEICSTYAEVKQRWLVVYSDAAYRREVKTLEKRIVKELE